MRCDEASELIGACRDEELTAQERRTLEAHLATCPACRERLADEDRVGRAIREQARYASSVGLEGRVIGALEREKAEMPLEASALSGASAGQVRSALRPSWAGLAATAVLAAALSSAGTWWAVSSSGHVKALEREIASAHIRSLLQESPIQVASSDQHTVRPWFAGRADVAPMVRDLDASGFALLGGRLDFVDDRRVGVVVYTRRKHVINVFAWASPGALDSAPSRSMRNGYNLLGWTRGGVAYWAISDLNADELGELAGLL